MTLPAFDPDTLAFDTPAFLALLVVPAALAVLWVARLAQYRVERRRLRRRELPAGASSLPLVGELAFWACVIVAIALCVCALARPQARSATTLPAGADLVVLLDGSASMHADDMPPTRWQRSQQFVRTLAESLSWKGDRMSLALFAHHAAPQVRLTRDPNALLFFLDHLGAQSPFSLDDATTWDTNIEEGLRWGLRLIDADESLFGRRENVKAFVVVTDGQAWSGDVERALDEARERRIPVHVVGIGTTAGADLPEPERFAPVDGRRAPRIHARLDREALMRMARSGGGEYREIGRAPDRDLAFEIIQSVRRQASATAGRPRALELYWYCLAAAALVLAAGVPFLARNVQLAWTAASGATAAGALLALLN
jgi:Ca-activated chloride channel family protein